MLNFEGVVFSRIFGNAEGVPGTLVLGTWPHSIQNIMFANKSLIKNAQFRRGCIFRIFGNVEGGPGTLVLGT